MDALRRSGPATRADIVRSTHLSRGTVAGIVDALLAQDLLQEEHSAVGSMSRTRPGRPAGRLRLTGAAGVVAGMTFGHGDIRIVLATLSGEVLAEQHEVIAVDNSATEALDAASAAFCSMLDVIEERPVDVRKVVIGLPAPINRATGRVMINNILPGWVDRAPAVELQDRIHQSVVVENDANLAALGELTYGVGVGVKDLILVKASTGIGAGRIVNGRLLRGASGCAGELGHVQIQSDGAVCRCGSRGCLETMVSITRVVESLQPTHPDTILTIEDDHIES